MSTPKQPPIAIVGIGCLFPKSPDLSSYWRNIVAAADCIDDLPADHSWKAEDYFDADPSKKDKTWCTRGGFLDKVPFDPLRYGVPPNMLESIDTTQLLSLIVARETLRDAGLNPDGQDWDRDRVGCIIGITGTQEMAVNLGSRLQGPIWRKSLIRCGIDPALADAVVADIGNHFPTWTEQSFPGLLGNVVAGRIANRLDLGGTNCVVDAACASSLAAIQYGIGDLASGRSDLILSGGADTLNDPFMFQCFTRTPAFSKRGDATPFDAKSDGILIGEGVAMIAMKRLEDAERDGDRVYAVIRGLGSSSDGKFKSIYAPNSSGQAKALRRTYEMADIHPDTIELVEAHGTGTKAGDVAEIGGLTAVYGDTKRTDRWVALGTVKSQIGHTKSTAGAAGLVKAVLALHQRVLPPTAKITEPNPKMNFDQTPFYLSTRARPWIRAADHPRRAAVSAFGFGGSNFHAVLEEHGPSDVRPIFAAEGELFLFGADTVQGLRDQLDTLESGDWATLSHAAREVQTRWTPSPAVLGFVAGDAAHLAKRIAHARRTLDGTPLPGIHFGTELSAPRLGFLFPGQGSQHLEMGRGAALRYPAIRASFDRADEHFREAGRTSLSAVIYPPPAFDDTTEDLQRANLRATKWAQPALGAISKGYLDALTEFGVKAAAVAGHSYGELVALHASGVWDEAALLTASRLRGEHMNAGDRDRGTMAAVTGPLDQIQAVLDTLSQGVVLANRNHPEQGVISGGRSAVQEAIVCLEDAGLSTKSLQVSAAFHSPLVADAQAPFAADLESISFGEATIPVFSNTTAKAYPTDPAEARKVLALQLTSPVDFVGMIREMSTTVGAFLEVGPKGVLTGLVRSTLGEDVPVIATNALRNKVDADVQLKEAIAALAAIGVPVTLAPLLAETLPIAPRTAGSKATVWLGGANFKNPSTLEPPMPELPKIPSKAPILEADAGWGAVPSSGAPVSKPPALAKSHQTAAVAPAAPTMASGDLAALLESTRQTLSAFQSAQQQTAEVHGRFLDAWSEASRNFTRLFETHARLVELATTGQTLSAPLPALATPALATPAPIAQPLVPPAPVFAAPVSAPATPIFASAPAVSIDDHKAELPAIFGGVESFDTGRINIQSASTPNIGTDVPMIFDAAEAVSAKSVPMRPTAIVINSGPSRDDLVAAMMNAVAAKTGYPLDMLELEMDLESDLGVDSIKRVEILSAVQEAVPSLPELDNDKMSSLRTLAEVVDLLASVSGASTPTITSRTEGPSRSKLVNALLASVAAKTGYPLDMLEMTMDLESDLGVDSIKRVEILSAVQDDLPSLPELDNDKMSSLRTLNDVADYLCDAVGADCAPLLSTAMFDATRTVPRDQLQAALLDAVSAKTGYPRDMLELEMDLESDLGVDSIKRVEILSAVQEQVPELPELDNDTMAKLRTLHEVVEHMVSQFTGLGFALVGAADAIDTSAMLIVPPAAPTPAPKADAGPPMVQDAAALINEPDVTLRRRVVRQLCPGKPTEVGLESPILITVDEHGRAAELAQHLESNGHTVHLLDADWTTDAIEVPPGIRTAIHLAAAGASESQVRARVRGGFLLAKALGNTLSLFATVSAMGGQFGFDTLAGHALEGALAGLPKTLSHEWPDARFLAIDIAHNTETAQLATVLGEDRGAIEVGLSDQVRVIRNVNERREHDTAANPLANGDLVVVSGGARGVTAAVVIRMAQRFGCSFLLLGRSEVAATDPSWAEGLNDGQLQSAWIADCKGKGDKPLPKPMSKALRAVRSAREVRSTLDQVREAGSSVTYVAVDVRDQAGVSKAIATAVESHGPVRGVVHGAGILADKLVLDKTPESFDAVFSTKVDGLYSLLNATNERDLKVLIAFTSVAGRFGNGGQVDYSMANEALTHLLLERAQAGVRAIAFDWGPWDGGMVTPALKRQFAARGLTAIPLRLGAEFLCDELVYGQEVEVVVEGPRPTEGSLTRNFRLDADPWLAHHTIGHKPVVPITVVLEWMAQIAREIFPAMHVSTISDLAVLKGIVAEGTEGQVTLSWLPAATREGGRALTFQITGGLGPLGSPRVHYRAVVDLVSQWPSVDKYPGSNGLSAEVYPHGVAEAYDQFLFHGPSFQAIDNIVGISEQGMVANLETHNGLGRGGTWHTQPVLLDAALQMLLLWVRERDGVAALPCLIKEYRQFKPFPNRVSCHLEVDRVSRNRGRFTATLVDADNDVVATLTAGEYTADAHMNQAFTQRGH